MDILSSHSDRQKRTSFLDLPGEIRDKIYYEALITRKALYWIDMVEKSLVPPPLLRVNRQIRAEALPMFYGKNEFFIDLPSGSESWTKLFSLFADMAAHGHLQYITELTAMYGEDASEDVPPMEQVLLGFELKGSRPNYDEVLDRRIGDDHFAWSDHRAVKKAFYDVLASTAGGDYVGGDYIEMWNDRGIEIDRVADALFALAQHCLRANKYVWLLWDFMV